MTPSLLPDRTAPKRAGYHAEKQTGQGFDDNGGLVPTTEDPREEIFNRLDGPVLDLSDREGVGEGIVRIFQHFTRQDAFGNPPTKEIIAGRVLSVSKIFLSDAPTGPEIERLYGISEASQSQFRKFFRKEFGDIPNLRTRNADERTSMSKAGLERWKRRKEKGSDATPSQEMTTDSRGQELNAGVQ